MRFLSAPLYQKKRSVVALPVLLSLLLLCLSCLDVVRGDESEEDLEDQHQGTSDAKTREESTPKAANSGKINVKFPTDPFSDLELQNPSYDAPELHTKLSWVLKQLWIYERAGWESLTIVPK